MAGGSESQQITTLGVSVAGQNWLVDMADISEVLSPQANTSIPMAKAWVLGVTNVRGSLYCVTDLAAYLGLGQVRDGIDNRLLLVAERYAFNAALLVDKVLGLRDARNWRKQQGNYVDEKNVIWQKLDIQGLLGQAEFLQIGA